MSEIEEAVARAMAQKDAEDEGLKFPASPMAYRAYMGLARAAIEAYEAAKREERHVIRIENGVVYFSDGTAENPAEAIAKANRDNGIGKLFQAGLKP